MEINLISERDSSLSYIDQILHNRGVQQNSEEFFQLDWDIVNSPFNLNNMPQAVELYKKHIENNSKIAIIVDVDIDGFSSAALLINYTNMQRKYGTEWAESTAELVPMFHKEKIHGLNDKELMRRIRDEVKPDLLVIPDASGTNEQYKAIVDLGIDILVLDHHDTSEYGDNEHIVVVNNQHSEKYTNKDFSGVGIVWQFCRAVDAESTLICADHFLDLVALGNIGDVMDLRSNETRFICTTGLEATNITSQFFHYLKFSSYSLRDKDFNPDTIAFNVAPMFNAVCRIGEMSEKEMLFKCLLDDVCLEKVLTGKRGHANEEVQLVEEGCRLAANARGRQNTRKDKLVEKIEQVINDECLYENKVILLAFDDFKEEYRALAGLVCNKLLEYYKRPIIITFKNLDGSYSGSFRAPDKIPAFQNFKDQCAESGFCTFVAGHQQAAGIGIKENCVEDLILYFERKYENIDTTIREDVDFVFDANDPEIVDYIEEIVKYNNVWGTNLESPKIAITNVKIGVSTMNLCGAKKNTLKINLPYCELINFNSSQTEYESLKLPYNGVEQYYLATVICHDPGINEYMGKHTPQLQFSSYELNNVKYDF